MHLRGNHPQVGDSVSESIRGYERTYTVVNASADEIVGIPVVDYKTRGSIHAGSQYFRHNSGTENGGSTSAEDYFGGDY